MVHQGVLGRRAALLACAMYAGCTTSDGRPPVARIAVTPTAIPEGDGFATTVILDGTASASIDPSDTRPLTFRWELDDDTAHADASALDQPMLTATFAGARPPRIVLTVTDAADLSDAVTHELELTVAQ
jgi:hypothetical protein